MQDERPTPRVVVIGAGAAGSLTALHLARAARRRGTPSTSSWSTPPASRPGHGFRDHSTRSTCSTSPPAA